MTLTWQDPWALAETLERTHPDRSLLSMDEAELATLVQGLADFDDTADADARTLAVVRMAWITEREGVEADAPSERRA